MPGNFLQVDLVAMMDTAEFASAVTLGTGTAATTVAAIFDAGYSEPLGEVQSVGPQLTLPTTSAAGVAMYTAVTIGTTAYRVIGIEPDGTGITVLRLELQ